jgi:hypothetical protein
MTVGDAVNERVGTGGGGTAAPTVTVAVREVLPLLFEQFNAKLVVVCRGAVVNEPEVGWAPLQPPDAEQVDAPVVVHVSVDVPPAEMLVGDADRLTEGADSPPPLPPLSERTSIALTHASPTRRVKTRLRVASAVTMNTRSATVLAATTWLARTTWPSASTRKLRVLHQVHDSRNRSVTSTCPGVTGMAYEKEVADHRSVL